MNLLTVVFGTLAVVFFLAWVRERALARMWEKMAQEWRDDWRGVAEHWKNAAVGWKEAARVRQEHEHAHVMYGGIACGACLHASDRHGIAGCYVLGCACPEKGVC